MCGTGSKHSRGGLFGAGFGSSDPKVIRSLGGVPIDSSGNDIKESTPPVQRSAPSSSGGELTSLGIRRRGSAQKRGVSSGRSRSKSERFSTG